jgi:hypothetical protein
LTLAEKQQLRGMMQVWAKDLNRFVLDVFGAGYEAEIEPLEIDRWQAKANGALVPHDRTEVATEPHTSGR